MTAAIRKVGEKLVDLMAGWVAVVVVAIATAAIGYLSGNRDVSLYIAALLLAFAFGIWVGSRIAHRQLMTAEKTHSEKSVTRGNLFVVAAFYGVGVTWVNVTEVINRAIREEDANLEVNNNLLSSEEKERMTKLPQRLILAYVCNKTIVAMEADQNDTLHIAKDRVELVKFKR